MTLLLSARSPAATYNMIVSQASWQPAAIRVKPYQCDSVGRYNVSQGPVRHTDCADTLIMVAGASRASTAWVAVALLLASSSSASSSPARNQAEWETALAPRLAAATSAQGGAGYVTLLAADEGHVPGLLNWLGVVPEGVLDTTLVLSLDRGVHELLVRHGATSVLVERDDALRQRDFVWLTRMELAAFILGRGVDVLMSDIDAHWLRDPLPTVRARLDAGAHIVSSRATKWPQAQVDKWGAVLCMGFVYVRSAPASLDFIGKVVGAMHASERPDDQVSVNQVLDAEGLELAATPDGPAADCGATAKGLRVDLLSSYQVHRGFVDGRALAIPEAQAIPGLLVYHCPDFLRSADGVTTIQLWVPRKTFDAYDEHLLREAGLWKLRDDWRSVSAAESLGAWIRTVTTATADDDEAEGPAEDPLTVFLHVPKAAGTSFSHALLPVFDCDDLASCSRSPAAESTCHLWGCRGHFDMSTVERELHKRSIPVHSTVLVTMLRSPAERVISEHKYALARPKKNKGSLQFLQQQDTDIDKGSSSGNGFGQLMSALRHNMSLTDYINVPFKQGEYGSINNRQVSLLAGSAYKHERSEFQLPYALRNLLNCLTSLV